MENAIYRNGRFGEDCLVDPSQEFDLDFQHVLLGDDNFIVGDFYLPSDEELQVKSALLDEDEGFNEDLVDELRATVAEGHANSQKNGQCSRAAVDLLDNINFTMATASSYDVVSFVQAVHGGSDPGSSIDNCYDNSLWTNDAPVELTGDHMTDHVTSVTQSSREPSPLLDVMYSEDIYKKQSVTSHDQHNELPNNEELISMPFYKFKRLLDNPFLSVDNRLKAKAIRKKGKNKSAARHCRQRKMAMLEGLEQEVAILRQQQSSLSRQKALLVAEAKFWETRCSTLQ